MFSFQSLWFGFNAGFGGFPAQLSLAVPHSSLWLCARSFFPGERLRGRAVLSRVPWGCPQGQGTASRAAWGRASWWEMLRDGVPCHATRLTTLMFCLGLSYGSVYKNATLAVFLSPVLCLCVQFTAPEVQVYTGWEVDVMQIAAHNSHHLLVPRVLMNAIYLRETKEIFQKAGPSHFLFCSLLWNCVWQFCVYGTSFVLPC